MRGKAIPPVMIEPNEAVQLSKYMTTGEMDRAKDLFEVYQASEGLRDADLWKCLDLWDIMSLLAFVYDTGRVQGIREERARKPR